MTGASDVEILREAAARMRALAEATIDERDFSRGVAKMGRLTNKGRYMEAMRPEVALAVADWMDAEADEIPPAANMYRDGPLLDAPAFKVARVFLGTAL